MEILNQLAELNAKADNLFTLLDLPGKEGEIKRLEGEMNDPVFWHNQKRAKFISRRAGVLRQEINDVKKLQSDIKDLLAFAKEDKADKSADLEKELEQKYYEMLKKFQRIEISVLLNGKYDSNNAVLTIYAGAGGTEAQDWAEMLKRMYLRFCESKNWQCEIIDESKGTEAGLKSVSIEINGNNVYGYLKAEAGVHRLVRLSPFDADHARHTSFAMVETIPEIEHEDFKIKEDDLKIEANTATGHGGQSVNTTYSAIRITHLPTGIKVSCQNERSQSQNKETALKVLKGKLAKYYEALAEDERMRLRGELTEAAWGNQIRSYVLHPYKMVKDHRTNYEEHEPNNILDGELDNFIEVYLKSQIK